jgi:hypothetical protein
MCACRNRCGPLRRSLIRGRFIHVDGSPFAEEEQPTAQTLRTGVPCRNVPMLIRKASGALVHVSVNTSLLTNCWIGDRYFSRAVVASYANVTALHDAETRLHFIFNEVRSWRTKAAARD